jgi:serine/threonine-protein kinase RsbW
MPLPNSAKENQRIVDDRLEGNGWSARSRDPRPLVEIEIDSDRSAVDLRATADKDGLPLVRQALRALGQSVGADSEAVQDTELALTEACANVVRHAYPAGHGMLDVGIEAHPSSLVATVRDQGMGMSARDAPAQPVGGLGLKVIDAVASEVTIRTGEGLGTEVSITVDLAEPADGAGPGGRPLTERVARRVVAIVAAQSELPPSRITEALLVTELVVRHVGAHQIGPRLKLRVRRGESCVELFVGPLLPGGAAAIVDTTELPTLGSVVTRLADAVWRVPPETGRPLDGEELAIGFST